MFLCSTFTTRFVSMKAENCKPGRDMDLCSTFTTRFVSIICTSVWSKLDYVFRWFACPELGCVINSNWFRVVLHDEIPTAAQFIAAGVRGSI
jgi:hypothetical protein